MCECGCEAIAERLTFPGPKGGTYVISLHGACTSCTVGAAVRIELYEKTSKYKADIKEFSSGPLEFQNHERAPNDGEVTIITGMNEHEFRTKLKSHLIGLDAEMFDDATEAIDEIGADTILDEMYSDAQVCPHVDKPGAGEEGK